MTSKYFVHLLQMSTWRNWLRSLISRSDSDKETAQASVPPSKDTPASANILEQTTVDDGISPQEFYPLAPIKRWVGMHISPYAWDRAVIRSLSSLQQTGIPLPLILAPKPDTKVSGAALRILLNSLHEMYGMKPDLRHIFQSQEV